MVPKISRDQLSIVGIGSVARFREVVPAPWLSVPDP